jgi:hypothetical protein
MHRLLTLLYLLTLQAIASVPLQLSDDELAAKSDHVFVAHVVAVDMIDGKGRNVDDDDAKTGPGSENVIRLKVKIDEVLFTNAKESPKELYIPLDSFMHYRLKQVKEAHAGKNSKFLLLLAGDKFTPPQAGVFRRDLTKKAFFVEHVGQRNQKKANKP